MKQRVGCLGQSTFLFMSCHPHSWPWLHHGYKVVINACFR